MKFPKFNPIVVSIFLGLTFLLAIAQVVQATPDPIISNVLASNPTSNSITISWVTSTNTSGNEVYYGTSNPPLTTTNPSDDQGNGYTHYVNITGLSADTLYYFKVESEGVVVDDAGSPFQFKTAKSGTGNLHTLQGKVKHGTQGVRQAIVKVTVTHGGVVSAPLTDLTAGGGSKGSWSVNLSNLKYPSDHANAGQVLPFSQGEGGDAITIFAIATNPQGASGKTGVLFDVNDIVSSGIQQDCGAVTVKLDTAAPDITITSPTANSIWKDSLTLSATLADPTLSDGSWGDNTYRAIVGKVMYKITKASGGKEIDWTDHDVTSPADEYFDEPDEEITGVSIDITSLPIGEHILHVKAEDGHGNWSDTPQQVTFKKDDDGPETTITSPAANTYFAATPPEFSATITDVGHGSSNVTKFEYKVVQTSPAYDSGWQLITIGTPAVTKTVTQSVDSDIWSNVSTGDFTLYVRGYDVADNAGAQTTVALKKDTTAPSVTIDTPAENSHHKTAPTFTATIDDTGNGGSDITDVKYKVTQSGNSDASLDVWNDISFPTNGASVTVSETISSAIWSALNDGDFVLYVQGTDVGNTGQTNRTLRKDTTGPGVTINSPAAGTHIKNPPTFTATITDPAPGSTNITDAKYKVNQGGYTSDWYTASLSGFGTMRNVSQTIDSSVWNSLNDGDFTLYVQGADELDNTGESNRTLRKDETEPTVTINSPAANAIFSETFTFTATIADPSPGSSNVTAAHYQVEQGGSSSSWYPAAFSSGAGASRDVSQTIRSSIWDSLGQGNFTLYLKGADVLGNAGQTTRVFKKDTVGPAVAITAPPLNSKHGTPPTLTATVDDSANGNSNVSAAYYKVVQSAYDSGWQTASLSGSGATQTVSQAISSNIWNSLADGEITVYIQGVDEAGNTGEASRTLKVDATAPAVTITAPAAYSHHKTAPMIEATIDDTGKGDSNVTSADYKITQSGTPPYDSDWQTLTLSGSGATRTVSQAISSTIWDDNLNDGDFVLYVRGTDEVNNTRESERTLWKDTTPPNATINSPPANTPLKTAPTFSATITDPSPGSSKVVKYYYKVDSGSWTSVDVDAASQSVTVGISRSISDIWGSIGEGAFTLYVRGEDVVQNTVESVPHASIGQRMFKRDTTSPTVSNIQLTLNSPLVEGHGAIHLTADVDDIGDSGIQKAQYALKTNGTWGDWIDMTGNGAPPVSASADINTTYWPPGRYEVKVKGIDNAGNEGTESSPVKIDVPVISGITASSISDTEMAVSWLTDIEAIDLSQTTNGIVRYDTGSLTAGSPTASESRTPGDDTHRVVITGLTAGNTYNYQVTSGATVSASGQFAVPSTVDIGDSYTLQGYVKSSGTGVANVIVYVTVNHNGTESTVSTLSQSSPLGYWEVDIKSIAYGTGDSVKIRATMNSGGARLENTTISGTSPQDVGDINLSAAGPSISNISTTLDPGATSYTLKATVNDASASNATVQSAQYKIGSSSWVSMTPADGAADSVSEVFSAFISVSDFGSSGNHTIYIKGTDAEGFTTQSGSYGSTSITVYPATNSLVSGLNLVSLQRAPINNTLTSYNVIPTISNGTAAYMYKLDRPLQQWVNAIDDGGVIIGEDFDLVTGDGYFIQVDSAAIWTYNGTQITSEPSPLTTLQKGGSNLIGVPYNVTDGLTADNLINAGDARKIPYCTSVSKWDTSTQQ